MTLEEKKTWLCRYRPALKQIEGIASEKQEWQALQCGNANEVAARLEDELRCTQKIREEIANAIAQTQEYTLQYILHSRYIEGITLEAISEKLDYSYRQILRLHKKALEGLKVPS